MTRRTFTFASLALAGIANVAVAGEAAQTQQPAASEPTKRPLSGRWSVHTATSEGATAVDQLVVGLKVVNDSADPIDVMVAIGSRPGADMTARITVGAEDVALAAIASELSRADMMSRMGPRPRYEAIATGAHADLGEYRFSLPAGAENDAVQLTAQVSGDDGKTYDFAYAVPAGNLTPA
jgi:hypothetical protein